MSSQRPTPSEGSSRPEGSRLESTHAPAAGDAASSAGRETEASGGDASSEGAPSPEARRAEGSGLQRASSPNAPGAESAAPQSEGSQEQALPFFVVGVGASAGGLEALQAFFHRTRPSAAVCYVVVQHLSPDFKSMMSELLSRRTSLEVHDIRHGTAPRPGCIYLLGPKQVLTLEHGRFCIQERFPSGLFLPINLFFGSLATHQGDQCAAVVLSGTGTDGTHGARQVKEAGGLVAVQEPGTAKFDGMPNSVISAGLADVTGGPAQLADRIAQYVAHPLLPVPGATEPVVRDSGSAVLQEVLAILRPHARLNFGHYKEGTVLRRLHRRASLVGDETLEAYMARLRSDPEEIERMSRELLIGVTQFFRDVDSWAYLEKNVIPRIVEGAEERGTLRLWVAGCATGEEAYTLAMLVEEQLQRVRRALSVRLFATDARRDSLRFARIGQYPAAAGASIPEALREKYFELKGDALVARRPLRDMITFAPHDVLQDPPFTQLSLITCRNLLIYLTAEAQRRVLGRFRVALREGGYLFLGASETVGEARSQFGTVHSKANVFVAQGVPHNNLGSLQLPIRDDMLEEASYVRPSPSRATEALLEAAVRHFAPPGVAVDQNLELLQVFGRVSDYIEVPPGRVTTSLLRMMPQALSVMVNSAAKKCLAEGSEVTVPALRLETPGGQKLLTLRVVPADETPGLPRALLVFFQEERERRETEMAGPGIVEGATRQRLQELEDELVVAREGLQSAVQDQEATNEELQATNEELTASNEELQSTNEELQSVNEELYTVNSEYQQKISELEELNSDLENLLRVIDAGVLFLDHDLLIRRFNQSATRLLPLRQEDVGRPLNEIAVHADYPNLALDAKEVLRSGVPSGRNVLAHDGAWWDIGMRIFTASSSPIGGVIVTMKEVSELKQAIGELSRVAHAHRFAELTSGSGYAIIDLRADTVAYSAGASRLFGLGSEQTTMPLALAMEQFGMEERHGFRRVFEKLKPGRGVPFTAVRRLVRPDDSIEHVRISVQVSADADTDAELMFAYFQPCPAPAAAERQSVDPAGLGTAVPAARSSPATRPES